MCDKLEGFSIIDPVRNELEVFEVLKRENPLMTNLESRLDGLSFGEVVDAGNLDKGAMLALRDIYSDKYIVYSSEDEEHPGKYALAFQLKEDKRNA